MYECYECGVDRGGSGMREDGNCIDCGPVTKKKLKRRVEELIEAHDRLAAENAELRKEADEMAAEIVAAHFANATLDALRELCGPNKTISNRTCMKMVDILYPQPAAPAEEKENGN